MNTNSVDFFKRQNVKPIPKIYNLILAVWNIKSPKNMGHIVRMAHNLGAENVLFIGNKNEKRRSEIKKTAGFSFEQQNWELITKEDFFTLLLGEHKLIALETCKDSKNIFDIEFPPKVILLGGNESNGLPDKVLQIADKKVYIPMAGGCKSMNVSHALTVAAFEWYRQIKF